MKTKSAILALMLFIVANTGIAQLKKVHAYKQASLPGIVRDNDQRVETFNYWFYIEVSKPEKIRITGLWIAGKQFESKTETITSLPVKKIVITGASDNDTIIMAPATRNVVLLVYPSGEKKDPVIATKYLSGLISSSELVIAYIWKGKKYYATVKKIKTLAPDAHS
jgi:hypothetical protein